MSSFPFAMRPAALNTAMKKFRIAPSILAADFARLGEEAQAVITAGADMIHFDVMDNHYVPNLSVGPMVCQALRAYGIKAPIDVHLMTRPVDALIDMFIKAGASSISFHPEACDHIDRNLQKIRDSGLQAGLALNPATSPDVLSCVMERLDFILLMSVNPGFGGQAFIPSTVKKARHVKSLIESSGCDISLAVDGGVTQDNLAELARAGADTFIAGSAIYGTGDYGAAIAAMRASLEKAI